MGFFKVEGIAKSFASARGRTEVLRDVSLEVTRGELMAIVGYSGAGKTTLISIMAGLLAPDAGTVMLDGRPATQPGRDRGVVFQGYALLPWLTAYENVRLGVEQAFPTWTADKQHAHTQKYLGLVNLAKAGEKRPKALSGGMRQRVALARALAMEPEVLLMDEPLGALDALTRATLQDELGRICREQGRTIVLITNDVDEATLLADRIIPLSAGPGATLGPVVPVGLPYPRDRKTLPKDARAKAVRQEVLAYLLGPGRHGGQGGRAATSAAPAVRAHPEPVRDASEAVA